jgi:hypothetical protein
MKTMFSCTVVITRIHKISAASRTSISYSEEELRLPEKEQSLYKWYTQGQNKLTEWYILIRDTKRVFREGDAKGIPISFEY